MLGLWMVVALGLSFQFLGQNLNFLINTCIEQLGRVLSHPETLDT